MAKIKPMKLTREEQYTFNLMVPCLYCKHLLTVGRNYSSDPVTSFRGWTCKAFPLEIPSAILHREESHTEVDWGQTGSYVYSPKVLEYEAGKAQITFDGEILSVADYKQFKKEAHVKAVAEKKEANARIDKEEAAGIF